MSGIKVNKMIKKLDEKIKSILKSQSVYSKMKGNRI